MGVLKFITVRLCPWDMHLTGRRRSYNVQAVRPNRLPNFRFA